MKKEVLVQKENIGNYDDEFLGNVESVLTVSAFTMVVYLLRLF